MHLDISAEKKIVITDLVRAPDQRSA